MLLSMLQTSSVYMHVIEAKKTYVYLASSKLPSAAVVIVMLLPDWFFAFWATHNHEAYQCPSVCWHHHL